MTLPLSTLIGFSTWTLLLLALTVGVHRWSLILRKRAAINAFPPDAPHGPGWYQRATRAHLNCIENLPPYGAIVLSLVLTGRHGTLIDTLAIAVLAARICQTTVHVLFVQSERAVTFRFSFYMVQLIAMLWLTVLAFE